MAKAIDMAMMLLLKRTQRKKCEGKADVVLVGAPFAGKTKVAERNKIITNFGKCEAFSEICAHKLQIQNNQIRDGFEILDLHHHSNRQSAVKCFLSRHSIFMQYDVFPSTFFPMHINSMIEIHTEKNLLPFSLLALDLMNK